MAVNFKMFSSGKLGHNKPIGMLYSAYSVPVGRSAIVKTMSFVNTHSQSIPVTVAVKQGVLGDMIRIYADYRVGPGLQLLFVMTAFITCGRWISR